MHAGTLLRQLDVLVARLKLQSLASGQWIDACSMCINARTAYYTQTTTIMIVRYSMHNCSKFMQSSADLILLDGMEEMLSQSLEIVQTATTSFSIERLATTTVVWRSCRLNSQCSHSLWTTACIGRWWTQSQQGNSQTKLDSSFQLHSVRDLKDLQHRRSLSTIVFSTATAH